jgi:hypothetical protein
MRSRDRGRKCDRSTATYKLGTVSLTADNKVFLLSTAHPTTRRASVALDFFIGILLVDTTAIAQQAVCALGNCFFCSGQTTIRQVNL